jgi:hypothetical protein
LDRPREFVLELIRAPPEIDVDAELRRHDVSKYLAKVRRG